MGGFVEHVIDFHQRVQWIQHNRGMNGSMNGRFYFLYLWHWHIRYFHTNTSRFRHLSRDMTKPTMWLCAQRRLRSAWASTQSDKSSLCAQLVAKDPSFLHVDTEDSDQTGRMPRLNWVFAGRTLILLVFSCRGSYVNATLLQTSSQKHYPTYRSTLHLWSTSWLSF